MKRAVFRRETPLRWDGWSLIEIRNDIDRLLNEYGDDSLFELDSSGYGWSDVETICVWFEDESDEAYEKRKERARKQAEKRRKKAAERKRLAEEEERNKERRELEEYLRLRAKYEGVAE